VGRSRQRKRERPKAQASAPAPRLQPVRGASRGWAAPPLGGLDGTRARWALVLVALAVVAYLPALGAGFIWDDNLYVTGNADLRSADGLRIIWTEPLSSPQYYPLVFTSFWLEYQLFGPDPRVFHLTNVLLHALSAVVLWRLLVRLAVPGAWLAAAVFAVHPVHVESVAWVTERKNVLSGLFYLTAFRVLLEPMLADRAGASRAGAWIAGTLLFVAALLSKTVTASLPAALLLVVWWKRGLSARDLLRVAPLFALGIASGLGTAWLERSHVGASGPEWDLSFWQRGLIAGRALWFYLGKLVWPHPLVFIYPRWEVDAGVWWQWLFPLAALGTVAALALAAARLGRAPVVAALLFAGTLFPALGFVNIYPMLFSFVADHFQYLASIAPIAGGVALAAGATRRLAGPARSALAALLVAALGGLTMAQARTYESLEILYKDTLAKNPGAWLAHNNLGRIYAARGETAAALAEFEETLRLHPGYAEGHNNLAVALERVGRADEAIANYTEAVRLYPEYADANYNLARLLAQHGRADEAIARYQRSIRTRPGFAPARSNLGRLLYERGRLDGALAELRESLRLRPRHPETLLALGLVLEARGDRAGAAQQYAAAVQARPGFREAEARLAAVRDAR
jgi:protein O-mannosyl-transferase